MRDFRLIWIVTSVAAAAIVALFVAVMFQAQKKPSSSTKQTSLAEDKSLELSKTSVRLLAPTTLHYYRVKVALDGSLQTNKHTFRLYAAEIPGRQHTCTYRDGQRWACGLRSYVALVNLIGSDPIECRPKDVLKSDVVICHHDGLDVSEWMLKKGWARLEDGVTDARYVAAANAASTGKVGMWIEAPQPQQDATAQ